MQINIQRILEDGWIERFQQSDKTRDKQAYKLTFEGGVSCSSKSSG